MIYRQERVGRHGSTFTILKFRTMDDEGNVTRPWLRRTGLDELPQIVNVLRGDMAIFGPRPEVPEVHARCSDVIGVVWDERLRVKPGILSLASVSGAIRSTGRFDTAVKIEQAVLDNVQIDSGRSVRFAILRRLPRAILRGQRSEGGIT